MSSNVEFVVGPQHSKMRHGAYQITLAQSQDWARLWPRDEAASASFRIATLPIRLLSLALLWATSTPGRLLLGLVLAASISAVIIIR